MVRLSNWAYDLHRHDEFSLFDGFGKAYEAVEQASILGYPALGLCNHGNVSGLIKHYNACMDLNKRIDEGEFKGTKIKPILGLEGYFQPAFKEGKSTYHLGLFAKNKEGWKSLMNLTEASTHNFYYKPIITFKELAKYHEGLICTSACIGGILSQMIKQEVDINKTKKVLSKFIEIFGDDFYIEIMPYKVNEIFKKKDAQKYVNEKLMELAEEYDVKCILTTDSHYIKKEDFDTYLVMHELGKSNLGEHYSERYMPEQKDLINRFIEMHGFKPIQYIKNMKHLYDSVEDGDWLKFDMEVPLFTDSPEESYELMMKKCVRKLKHENKWNKTYKDRLLFEADVIKYHGFQDYFLLVQDYVVNGAKKKGIAVGPGRGSAGNSIVNYALGITEVDAIYFDNDFNRFLRKNRKKMPDIDVDFCTDRRQEVIQYVIDKYPQQAEQICSYGYYKAKNLAGDLAKLYDLNEDDTRDFKMMAEKYEEPEKLRVSFETLMNEVTLRQINKRYKNIVKHYAKLYGQIRYFGKHAAAVAITNSRLYDRVGVMKQGGMIKTAFDLNDIATLKVLKLDMLGLHTATMVKEMENATGEKFNYGMLEDEEVYQAFHQGRTEGIFQFESPTANQILQIIEADSMEDIIAGSSLNRPGPLSSKMHEQYAEAKKNPMTDKMWYPYTEQTYGTIVYQEQGMRICINIGGMDWDEADILVKDVTHIPSETLKQLEKKFVKNAVKKGMTKDDANDLFTLIKRYSFNRGHGTAYAMLSIEQMYFKVHHPLEFWNNTLKYTSDLKKREILKGKAVVDGCIVLLPHVNATAKDSIENYEGDKVLREGYGTIKNVGEKAAEAIEAERKKNGPFKSEEDFISRMPKRSVNKRVIDALRENGALSFNKKQFLNRVKKYNSTLFMKGMK